MGYVGNSPALKYTSFAVQHFTTSATTGYTLDHAVTNENDIRLVINNVVQQPGSSYAYTASNTTLTLSAATAGTDTMYCVFLGKAVQTQSPSQGSVGIDQLSATGTPNATSFLRGDNTWASSIDFAWQSVQTTTITAAAGKGYPVNTTSGAITMNLPAGSAGDQVAVVDYAGTFDNNNLTISANGSEKINGLAVDIDMATESQGATLTYIDSTQGWVVTSSAPDPGVSQLIPVTFKIWGAGGGGSAGGSDGRGGGGGGFVQGTQSFANGTSIIAVVGQGGSGGTGGKGGGGGGYTGVFNGSVTHGNALLIAGAGSGGARSTYYGTGGGGLTAGGGTGANPGGGGTQSAGGSAGSGNGNAGAALAGGSNDAGSGGTAFGGGGDGGGDNVSYTAGGGGSGYYGGGSAGNSGDGASGGAGSSYVGAMTSTTNTTGTSASSGINGGPAVNTSDAQYVAGTNTGGVGNSSSGSGNIGKHGSISYSINGAAYVTLSYTGGNQTITVSA